MRILIATDAWTPQVNGVVRTLQATRVELTKLGHVVEIVAPDRFRSVPCPTYPEIRLAAVRPARIAAMIEGFCADAIHIATEGPIGVAVRRFCMARGLPFTTAYHTQFPDYLARRTRLPAKIFWPYIRWFHGPARGVLASTPTIRRALTAHGLTQVRPWGRGVDLAQFHAGVPAHPALAALPGPILLSVGRVAVEKNLEAFLRLDTPGTKVVVGDGPARSALAARYPNIMFLGALTGTALASAYAAADVFVFPSRTDTFGLVMIEALACGTPVAAYPVAGPIDVLAPDVGVMRDDLGQAIAAALRLDRSACIAHAARFGWAASAREFLDALDPIAGGAARAA
ncbi:glycosyltransferase family 1 protein [Sphingomonas sp. 1P06PA]|uniref:glycosyltransferase family 4 protein n=1 Tax=Sphingomonas sp. 1P06PA TaxID=554121 RepID=UPI0039A5C806